MLSINNIAASVSILSYGFLIGVILSRSISHTVMNPLIYIPVMLIFLFINAKYNEVRE